MVQTLLIAILLIPLVAALAVAFGPTSRAKTIALLGTLIHLVAVLYAASVFDWRSEGTAIPLQGESATAWISQLGINLTLGLDSVAMMLLILTGILGPICVLASFTAITTRERTYYAWLLVLQAAMSGVFCARDVILFYICFEFTLIPMFILISLWGSTNRRKAAIKFFLYTFTGSVIALAGLVYVAYVNTTRSGYVGAGTWTFDIAVLERTAAMMSSREQGWVLLALLAGFAVKVPLFPVHTWLPLAHTEAPTAGSVILAGVLLKLGTYALYRFVLPFVPVAVVEYAPAIAVLCIVGILYGGLICWVQTDVKKLVAYSSVAHLGFCVLGMFALNPAGLSGSILYMINHGLSTGALFLLIGMVYERFHTRSMKELKGLAGLMPVWATFMVFFTMASVGLPGLNGFVSEFLCLMGTFQSSNAWGSGLWNTVGVQVGATPGELGPWFAAVAGTGMIIAAMYLLYMVGNVVWGKLPDALAAHAGHADHGHGGHGHGGHGQGGHGQGGHGSHEASALPRDLSAREIGILIPLAVLCIALGVYPKPVLEAMKDPIARTVTTIDEARRRVPLPAHTEHAMQDSPATEVAR